MKTQVIQKKEIGNELEFEEKKVEEVEIPILIERKINQMWDKLEIVLDGSYLYKQLIVMRT